MTGKLEIGPDGRVTGPVAITYNDPFPTNNGSWGSGAMMGVVMHTMVGNLQPTTVDLFNSSSAAVSAHFGIAQDGSVWQFGPMPSSPHQRSWSRFSAGSPGSRCRSLTR